jgi:hypothetical protein
VDRNGYERVDGVAAEYRSHANAGPLARNQLIATSDERPYASYPPSSRSDTE